MKHGKKKPSVSQAEFKLGYLYRTIEEHINRFAAEPGCPFTVADIALRMGDTLRLKAKEIREELWDTELVSQMRDTTAKIGSLITKEAVDVAPRTRRTLSKAARARIAAAQRKRWRLHKAKVKAAAKTAA